MLQKRLSSAENKYFLGMLQSKFDSNYKFWKHFGGIINPSKRKKKDPIIKIMHKGKIHHAQQDISNAFNDYFSTIGQNLSNNFPENSDFRKYMKTNSSNTIYMNPIVIKEVSIEINKLKINKSSGPDGVPPKVIKYASE